MCELLAPAGDLEKLKYAFIYGADACYLGGKQFGMRANAGNFSLQEIEEAVLFAHNINKKVYVTVNIAARNNDMSGIKDYVRELSDIGVDRIIAADTGVILTIKETSPNMKISLSTQVSTTNYKALEFWQKNGVDRVILARELSFDEIKGVCENKPKGMEVEIFIHGAMCISYSGRCLLSNYLTGRDANRGDCAQPCRWNYSLMEKTREGEYFPIEETKDGTFIFNSKDLCLIEKLPELIKIGVDSFKIEGRMKSPYYVSTVVNSYRQAIDLVKEGKEIDKDLIDELSKVSHRQYTTAFYDGYAGASSQNYGTSSYTRNYDYAAIVKGFDNEKKMVKIQQRNKFNLGDTLEVLIPKEKSKEIKVLKIVNAKGEEVTSTPHPKEDLWIKTDGDDILKEYQMLRKKL